MTVLHDADHTPICKFGTISLSWGDIIHWLVFFNYQIQKMPGFTNFENIQGYYNLG